MKEFVFRIRNDGTSILDVRKIDERLRIVANFLSQFEPNQILVVGRRDICRNPIQKFSEVTGATAIVGRYLPGTLTNPTYSQHFSTPKVVVICDPWIDRVAFQDALKIHVPIIVLADVNVTPTNVDLILPCNNKSGKAIALIFWILAREYLKKRGMISRDEEFKYKLSDFT